MGSRIGLPDLFRTLPGASLELKLLPLRRINCYRYAAIKVLVLALHTFICRSARCYGPPTFFSTVGRKMQKVYDLILPSVIKVE